MFCCLTVTVLVSGKKFGVWKHWIYLFNSHKLSDCIMLVPPGLLQKMLYIYGPRQHKTFSKQSGGKKPSFVVFMWFFFFSV